MSGTFGGAIALGNGLPHLFADDDSFPPGLAGLLLPGAPVLFQLLNYDRILDQRITSLPLNVREDDAERVVFLRLMDPRPDGTVLFNPTTLRWRPGEEPPVEVVTGKNVVLKAWRRIELEAVLTTAGFPDRRGLRRDETRNLGCGNLVRHGRPGPEVNGPQSVGIAAASQAPRL